MPEPLRWDTPGLRYDTPGVTWDGFVQTPTQHLMPDDNRISIEIPPATKASVLAKLAEIRALIAPFCLNLTPGERQSVPTIGTERAAMVSTFDMQMATHPTLVPPYVDMAEKTKDSAAWTDLTEMLSPSREISEMLGDTRHVAGADLLGAYLPFYGSVQQAAKHNVAGADTTLGTLRPFFPRGRRSTPTPPPAP